MLWATGALLLLAHYSEIKSRNDTSIAADTRRIAEAVERLLAVPIPPRGAGPDFPPGDPRYNGGARR